MLERNEAEIQLKALIEAGEYAPGDRLPAERELISNMGISRSTLRKGLDALERNGTIWRHVGKGTFVAGKDKTNELPGLTTLSQQITPVQMMRARMSLEPAIAREAAANASSVSVENIRKARDNSVAATSWDNYELNDDAFHRAVAEATGNVLLISLYDHLNQVQRAVAWHKVVRESKQPPKNHKSFAQHDAILAAIEARDPLAAHTAMRDHLNSVSSRLYGDTIP